MRALYGQTKKILKTSKMTLQEMIPKNEYANRQQYRQIATKTITNNHHKSPQIHKWEAKYHESEVNLECTQRRLKKHQYW